MGVQFARFIGVSADPKKTNKYIKSLGENAHRLKAYVINSLRTQDKKTTTIPPVNNATSNEDCAKHYERNTSRSVLDITKKEIDEGHNTASELENIEKKELISTGMEPEKEDPN